MPIGHFPESLSQAMLVGTILVGRLGVHRRLPEAISETANVLESRQKLLYTTPSRNSFYDVYIHIHIHMHIHRIDLPRSSSWWRPSRASRCGPRSCSLWTAPSSSRMPSRCRIYTYTKRYSCYWYYTYNTCVYIYIYIHTHLSLYIYIYIYTCVIYCSSRTPSRRLKHVGYASGDLSYVVIYIYIYIYV